MKYIKIIAVLFLFGSCANVGTLGGGAVDEQAPILVKTNLKRDGFTDKDIVLEFDEYISLNNAEKNISLIPKHSTFKISSQNRKVTIKLDSALKKNTCYNLIINGAIVDNNAGNNYKLNSIFSVNALQDSSFIKIKIPNIKEFKNIKASVNNNIGSDSFRAFNTAYTLAVETDEIVFRGIKDSEYNLWLYTDNNNDNIPDVCEPINFIKNLRSDSIYNVNLIEWHKPFLIKNVYIDKGQQSLKLTYNRNENTSEIKTQFKLDSSDIIIITPEYSIIKNKNRYSDLIKDTTLKFNQNLELKDWITSTVKIIKVKNNYIIEYKLPYDPKNYRENSHLSVIRKTLNIKPDTLIINYDNNAIRDTLDLGGKNIIEEQKLSHLNIFFIDTTDRFYDMKIFKDGKLLSKKYSLNSLDEYYEPGVYKLEIYRHNYEEIFSPYKMNKNASPIYEKVLYLKASWEEKLVIKIE